MKKEEKKVCRRCGDEKELSEFRTRPTGFTLNQCRKCESEMNKERRLKKKVGDFFIITTKRGKQIEASHTLIVGGKVASSPGVEQTLFFKSDVSRDDGRLALSTFAGIPRTGIKFHDA